MHIGQINAQSLAASEMQEALEARALGKANAAKTEAMRRLARLAVEDPESAVEEEEQEEGSSGGGLNAKA
jgi:hypothetical protein